ncbi:type VII secretion-associated serine protease mycosin [Salinispora tropica]|uniref:Peptidase S8 and S53, subtilisin, kexin, sedolisin n=1 Tax=Salinispora tropica (strain ATCC BAA-916 / DSM 44818 / JCM 13857 / NBRC 105044 / CNB-440) TaxID=369723 RepID=A4X256_SALTO|nr:type VII secretion-associated serine protease mycosin [Salinispora tropica]ABP52956.1 peptidase S8 and S53, subtilisin, kexin, sedolisin [Salinispora tropica CNB-440]
MRLAPRPATTIAAATLGAIVALGVSVLPAPAADRKDAWHLDALELADMHKITQGEGITVAVIDSGVDATHPDLKNNVLPGIDFFDEQASGHEDRSGHGTAMASLIAGHGHGPGGHEGVLGVAPKAKILPITVRAPEGKSNYSLEAIALGIHWAIEQDVDVINISLGGPQNVELSQAVERAYQNNVIVVAGVGNKENAAIGSPANLPGSLAVTGTDRDGMPSSIASLPAAQTHLAAPAEDLYQAVPGGGYATITGNSGATALVSGAVALVKSKYPNLNSLDLFKRMVETTRDAGKPGKDFDYGWGQLDLRAALTGEPDGRASRTQAPSQEPQLDPTLARARAQGPAGENEALVMALSIAFILVVLGLIATPVLLLLRYRRRRRATTPAMEAATATRTSATGLASPPTATTNPSESGPPAHPTDPADDSPWRRPD